MQARYYDPVIGRFYSNDPVGFSNVHNFNRYAYANNNPYKYVDPDGRESRLAQSEDIDVRRAGSGQISREQFAQTQSDRVEAAIAASNFIPVGGTLAGAARLYKVGKGLQVTRGSVDKKLTGYLLNKSHSVGADKANFFDKALGFTQANKAGLAKQIKFNSSTAVKKGLTQHGQKFEQVINIKGANGRNVNVTFGWIKNNDGHMRLVTGYPKK
jgi:uncharacterized protein RhaS with RHS repeats